jgi:cysteinyl-tRNA synthetase
MIFMKFYNTLTNKVEEFKEIKKGEVTLYTCGPTVYNFVHIGNLRAMLAYDLIKRYLKYKGYKVKHVMNITDVDDKTINGAKMQGKSLKDYTRFYEKAFFDDLEKLNIQRADIIPRATEEIDPMVDMINILLKKGFAYKSKNGDIYFKILNAEKYGNLANLDIEKLKENADGRLDSADEYDKEDAKDFALWKMWDEDDGDVFWETEIGKGRPGWHTECCVMSKKYLGLPIDIHMGGVDLIFPHHTNEIAQAEAAYGKKFVNYWLHNEHLIVNGEKMSKSLGNFFTLKDLLEKGYEPMAIRYELLKTSYRQRLDFKEEDLPKNKEILKKFEEFLHKLDHAKGKKDEQKVKELIKGARSGFEKEMDNDLNIHLFFKT